MYLLQRNRPRRPGHPRGQFRVGRQRHVCVNEVEIFHRELKRDMRLVWKHKQSVKEGGYTHEQKAGCLRTYESQQQQTVAGRWCIRGAWPADPGPRWPSACRGVCLTVLLPGRQGRTCWRRAVPASAGRSRRCRSDCSCLSVTADDTARQTSSTANFTTMSSAAVLSLSNCA